MTVTNIPNFTLHTTGAQIPAIGFGSGTAWQRIKKARPEDKQSEPVEELIESTKDAILAGFRNIDTAETYTTHEEVGLGIKRSGVPRSEIFLTDKYSPSAYARTKSTGPYQSLTTALKELDVGYIDLYLLHGPRITEELVGITLEEAWLQAERLYKEGLAKNIGVSNHAVADIERILKVATIKPQVNQIEYHAYLQNQTPGIIQYAKENDILIQAYSPLAPLFKAGPGPLDDLIPALAKKYGKTESQVLLRWVYQNGVLPLTTSSKVERLHDALNIFTFELEQDDVDKITNVGKEKLFRRGALYIYADIDNGKTRQD